jgi:hypothetical protein
MDKLFERVVVSGDSEPKSHGFCLENMDIDELLSLRNEIDQNLPVKKLADIDLEHELVIQFQLAKQVQAGTMSDDVTPANQKAQVLNSCTAVLGDLVKMQATLYSAERLKKIEQVLIETLQTWPADQTQEFFQKYEEALS